MPFNMKLDAKQKALLENRIYKLIKESFTENSFFENGFFEKKDDNDSEKHHKKTEGEESALQNKREVIMKWLDSEQELHSVLSYKLWPDKDKDQARSDFSKKWRGEDSTGKPYEFDDEEINRLYNLRSDFISSAGLD